MRRFSFKGRNKFRIPVEVAVLFVLTLSLQAAASTGPSWLQQPSWAKGVTGDRTPDRRPALSREEHSPTSPFAPGSNNLALDVGQVFLMGELGGSYSDSIGAQIHYTYGVSELFGFDSSFGYSEHSDGKFSMTTAITGLRTNLAWYDKVIPYFVFGMGFYRPSYRTTAVSAVEGDSVLLPAGTTVSPLLFGVHLGPGVDLEITKALYFGASLTVHDVFGSTRFVNDQPLSVGGTFTSFLLHAGMTF